MSIRIYGNRAIKTLPGQQTRPTAARVREAVFNIWRSHLPGSHWLDLCAGSGAMGAEALCRGAKQVTGIEQSGAACRVVQQNWQTVARPDQAFQILRGDVRQQLRHLAQPVALVYFDPPYASGLYEPVLAALAAHPMLTEAEIAVEHTPKHWSGQTVAGLSPVRQKRYGATQLSFFQVER
ncbi:MAG: 16S rRNA (guanine(966)-N(2))-methyltransferase RsmD [Cyanobacteria bacterium P01_A01_bin.105]